MADDSSATHVRLRMLQLPTKASLAAAHTTGPDDFRLLTIASAHRDGELDHALGWGECSALNTAGYTAESAESAFERMQASAALTIDDDPLASAAIEMMLLDVELRQNNESLADRLGTSGQDALAGAVVGLGPIPTMLDQTAALVEQGYRRIKCKIAPGRIAEPVRAIRTSFPDLELQVDANASLRAGDLPVLVRLRDYNVSAIEQPFDPLDSASAIRLIAESDVAVVADEAAHRLAALDLVAHDGAATAVAVKPPVLGGLRNALRALDKIDDAGLRASIGGMLECGLGRHQLAALAPLPIFSVTGDLSPARRWLGADPFEDITMRDGMIQAPRTPGIAGDPDLELLQRYTVREAVITLV